MNIPNDEPLGDVLKSIGDAMEWQTTKFARAIFSAMPIGQQTAALQHGYDDGLSVAKLSKLSGFSQSTIYTKIHVRK